ncbi:MAG: hypothetical protein WCT53_03865 [Candidatus Gracilibacteria bacterium]
MFTSGGEPVDIDGALAHEDGECMEEPANAPEDSDSRAIARELRRFFKLDETELECEALECFADAHSALCNGDIATAQSTLDYAKKLLGMVDVALPPAYIALQTRISAAQV